MAERTYTSCVSTLGCPDLTLDAVLELSEKFGVECLELRSLEGSIQLPECLHGLPGGLDEVNKKLARLKGGCRVLGTSCKLVGAREEARDELVEFARLADRIDTPYLRVFGGGKWGEELTDANYRDAIDFLNWWKQEREENGWKADIAIETHDAFSASPPLIRLFERLGRSVTLIWDTHHTWKLGGERPAESWNHLGEFTEHVHIKDSISTPSARHPYTYVLPGTGEMPMREVMDILDANAFTGSVALEWEKMWHPYLVDIAEPLAACRKQGWW